MSNCITLRYIFRTTPAKLDRTFTGQGDPAHRLAPGEAAGIPPTLQ